MARWTVRLDLCYLFTKLIGLIDILILTLINILILSSDVQSSVWRSYTHAQSGPSTTEKQLLYDAIQRPHWMRIKLRTAFKCFRNWQLILHNR